MKKLVSNVVLLMILGIQVFAQSDGQVLDRDQVSKEVLSALMITCYVCHNPRVKEVNTIAPPLAAVKYVYKTRYPEKQEFVDQVTDFVMNPNNQKALLQGPVMQFGVMPEMPLNEQQVRSIVTYIYDNKIEEPEWFPSYFENKHGMKWTGQ